MREIKFRAWKSGTKTMYHDVHNGGEGYFWNNFRRECFGDILNDEPGTDIMQFTGLKDKNGVEIWEGDVLKNERDSYLSYVGFNNGGFTYSECGWQEGNNPDTGGFLHADTAGISEVVGNIYENPELVEADK